MIKSSMVLRQLELPIFLGWQEAERAKPQTISLDLKIQFLQPPLACQTDELGHTFCYDNLTQKIKEELANQSFRLLEHLGYKIYHITKSFINENARIFLEITKKPAIEHLNGGASFCYGDEDVWLF